MKKLALFSLVCILASLSSAAHAQSASLEASAQPARKNEVRVDLGLGSAVGFAGVSYARSLHSLFDLEFGVGAGLSGVQLSAMGRLGLGSATHRFVVGAGLSMGTGVYETGDKPVGWFNAETGYQLRLGGGFTFLVTLGYTAGVAGQLRMNAFDPIVLGGNRPLEDAFGKQALTARVGFGFRF